MSAPQNDPLLQTETPCGSLLYELKIIWDEVGEPDSERDRMLFEIEQECLDVYKRRVDQANKNRAQLRQAIAEYEAELAAISSAMGERPVHIKQVRNESKQNQGGLKAELRAILPALEEMRKRRSDRRNQFVEVMEQIQKIKNEIYRFISTGIIVDESDLSLRKLEELHTELHALQKEKSERVKQVLDHLATLNSLCAVLGMDFKHTVNAVDPSLGESEGTKNISNDIIHNLAAAIQRLQEVKLQRMQQLQDLATSMLELWNLMDTPIEEQQIFQNVTCKIAATEHEITEPNMLSEEFISYVEGEVSRLEELKASKMKELVMKKRSELEEIYRRTHMVADSNSAMSIAIEAIESGAVDAASVLEQIELQIAQVKEEAFSRKDILDKVEKWIAACEEECWLEEYNRDENRYNAGRGTHLTLKRAEKARALVNKLPAMVEALASKTKAWENERGHEFTYDGIRLLSMLEDYTILREEKELERKRQRDQKKLQGQLMAEQEARYGSKPSPMKNQSAKKGPKLSCGGTPSSRRLSLGGAMQQTCKTELPLSTKATTPNTRQVKKSELFHQLDQHSHPNNDGFAALSAGRRGLAIDELPSRKHAISAARNGSEVETAMIRKPFSPISSKESSKTNATNLFGDLNRKQNDTTVMKTPLSTHTSPFSTPVKTIRTVEEENRTPQGMQIPVPCTPSTVSVPMQTTPGPAVALPYNSKLVENILPVKEMEMEYSFEERRLAFVLSRTRL